MKIIILLLLVSCGKQTHKIDVDDSTHTAGGQIDIVIDWNLDDLKDAFIDSCTSDFDTQEEIDDCVSDKITDLISIINGAIEEEEVL